MLLSLLLLVTLVLLLYNYRTGIITTIMVITNFGEFIYVNPNLEVGDFGGVGSIFFTDVFWTAMLIVILLKRDRLYLLNYKLSFLLLLVLFFVSTIVPILISSFSLKDYISVVRPLGNFLLLPYLVVTITGLKELNFFEKTIISLSIIFLFVQIYEYEGQQRIPIRLFERESVFFGENPFSVEFAGIKTGYIWSRIAYILPFNLFFGCYYYFTDKRNLGLLLIAIYMLSFMIALSRIWIIGIAFFLIVLALFLLLGKERKNFIRIKLFALIGSFILFGVILLFSSDTFSKIFDVFMLRINSINDLADKTDSSFLGREYIIIQMFNVWNEYPVFGAGFSSISRRLITNDLGFPNILTVFGGAGVVVMLFFVKQFFDNIKPFIKEHYILFAVLSSVMLMLLLMSSFSIDMFYFNGTGAMLLAFGNILYNIGNQESTEYAQYNYAV